MAPKRSAPPEVPRIGQHILPAAKRAAAARPDTGRGRGGVLADTWDAELRRLKDERDRLKKEREVLVQASKKVAKNRSKLMSRTRLLSDADLITIVLARSLDEAVADAAREAAEEAAEAARADADEAPPGGAAAPAHGGAAGEHEGPAPAPSPDAAARAAG